jgi:hypothetical protein
MKSPLFQMKNNYPRHVLKSILNTDEYKNHNSKVKAANAAISIKNSKAISMALNPKTESCELSIEFEGRSPSSPP